MKRTWLWIIIVILALAAAGAGLWYFIYRPQAAVTECSSVWVYDAGDYGTGDNACLAVRNYTADELATAGIPNDKIASIKVPSGFKATVYVENDFTGASMEVTTDLKNLDNVYFNNGPLGNTSWDDKISSIKVETAPACGAAVYADANYGGYGTCLAVGDYLESDLGKFIPNDDISSIKILSGFKATIYENNSYGGLLLEVLDSVADLSTKIMKEVPIIGGSISWNDQISSMVVASATTPPTPTTTLTLTANPATIASGATSTLTWANAENANTCTATPTTPVWFDKTAAGTATVKPTATTTYKLDCGGVTKEVVVTISASGAKAPTVTTDGSTVSAASAILKGTITSHGTLADGTAATIRSKGVTFWKTGVPVPTDTFLDDSLGDAISGNTKDGYVVNPPPNSKSLAPGNYSYQAWASFSIDAANFVGMGEVKTFTITDVATTCTAPTTETRTQTCPTSQTGSITQTRTKGDAPTCAWSDWTDSANTCAVASAATPPTATPSTSTATATTSPANTGPETPLVAGGLLSLLAGALYWAKRRL